MARKSKNAMLNNKKYTFAYFPGNSLMHKLNPISKLTFSLCLTVIVFLINSLIFLSLIALSILLIALISEISLRDLIRKLRFLIFILLFSVILNILFNAIPAQTEIVLFYLFGLPFLPIRRLAVYFALRMFLIIITLFTSTIIFTNTTSMKDFVNSLIKLKIPYKYCYAFMVGIKYIPLIEQEAKTISLAQRARGFGLEKANTIKKAYKLIFERMTTILVSILRKGQITSISMENRCFGAYKTRTNFYQVKFKIVDVVFIIICIMCLLLIILYSLRILSLPHFPSIYTIFFNTK